MRPESVLRKGLNNVTKACSYYGVIIKCVFSLQMPMRTRGQDEARTSRGGGEEAPIPPPVPPTLAEAIAALLNATADNARLLREMAGNQNNQHGGHGPNHMPRETTYADFLETRPPVFVKAEEPLEANEWLHVMEQKFGLIHCTETQKPLFAAQQLRGPASTWWANFVAIQPEDHVVTWAEFKLAFRDHYIPDDILQMKFEEFVQLRQGNDTVMQYLAKFNHLSQYAIDQVNTDLKKRNCFMRGLNDRLQRKMVACLGLTFTQAVSTAISVEAKNSGQGKTKRFGREGGEESSRAPEKRTRFVIRPFNQNRASPRPPSYPFK